MEHHLLITVPHYNLPEMHALLHSRGAIGEECITLGYAEILRNAASRAEDEAKAAAYRPPPRVPPF
jgi:fatty acid desaturase